MILDLWWLGCNEVSSIPPISLPSFRDLFGKSSRIFIPCDGVTVYQRRSPAARTKIRVKQYFREMKNELFLKNKDWQ